MLPLLRHCSAATAVTTGRRGGAGAVAGAAQLLRGGRGGAAAVAAGHARLSAMASEAQDAGAAPPRMAIDAVNESVKEAQYAVRGMILDRAHELEREIAAGGSDLPFDSCIYANIGSPQAMGQKPITFSRQVLAGLMHPALCGADDSETAAVAPFPDDVVSRVHRYLDGMPGLGAYSESQGIAAVRHEVADFIAQRDGYPCDPDKVFLTNGASEGVRFVMQLMLRDKHMGYSDGMLTPIPQYPLYSALTRVLNGELVPYYLNEADEWSMSMESLEQALAAGRERGACVRGMVVINPGNPTGQILSEENMREIVTFCAREGLVLMADEVYQENIYRDDRPFVSFKKVVRDMGYEDDGSFQLISFHSISKGFMGECGLRGGYFEIFGIDHDVAAQMYKLASISLCSNTVGQVMTGLMVNPPKEGEPSYELYCSERDAILASLRRRAVKLSAILNELEGVSSNPSDGAMYAFPQITLPPKAMTKAEEQGLAPDAYYCLRLLEATGIVVVPGSGFGQDEGTWHFRTTFLPPEDQMEAVMSRLSTFHAAFLDEHR